MSSLEADTPKAEPVAERSSAPLIGTSLHTLTRTLGAGALATIFQYVVTLAAFPFLVHRVGSETFGAWTAIASLLAVGALADAGARAEIVRRIGTALGNGDMAELKRSLRIGVGLLTLAGVLVAVVGIALASFIRAFTFPEGVRGYGGDGLDWVLRATILLLATQLVIDGHFAALRGVQRGDIEPIAIIAGVLPGTAAMLTLAYAGLGLWALFLGTLANALTRWVVQAVAMRRLLPGLGFGIVIPSGRVARSFLGFSALVLLSQVSDVVDSQWDKVVLARFVGPASVAFFAVGTMMLVQLKAVAVIPLTPILAAVPELGSRDPAKLEVTFSLLTRLGAALGSVLLTLAFVLGPAFFLLWLGPEFKLAGSALRLFAIAVAINLVSAPAAIRCIGQGWHRIAAVSALTNICVNGILSFVLAARLGFNGPLYGSIAGNAAGVAVFYALLWRRSRDAWTLPRLGAPILGAAVGAITIIAGLDKPTTWWGLVATTLVLGLALAGVSAMAERLPVRSFVRSRR